MFYYIHMQYLFLVDFLVSIYTADSEYIYQEMEREVKAKLIALANEACSFDKKRFAII